MVVANAALTAHGMRLDMLTRDVGLLRQDVTALRRGQEELHVRLDALQAGQDALQARQDAFQAGQDDLRARQDALQAGQESLRAEMNARFDALEKTVTAIAAAVVPSNPAPAA